MHLNKKIVYTFALSLFLVGCQNSAQEKEQLINDILAIGNSTTEGAVVFSHSLNDSKCYTSYTISGRTDSGEVLSKRVLSTLRGFGKTPVFATTKLPSGSYQLASLECIQSYRISGLGPLARFNVKPGQISNLQVLSIKTKKSDKLFGRETLQRSIRQFTAEEIKNIAETNPNFPKLMVDSPMTTDWTVETLPETLDLRKDLHQQKLNQLEKEKELQKQKLKEKELDPNNQGGYIAKGHG